MDIIISNQNNTTGGTNAQAKKPAGNTATAATKDSAVKQTANSVYAHQILSMAKSTAKQTAKFAISQYGDMTGDYIGQRKIDRTLSIVEGVVSIGTTGVMGAMSGGLVGAIVGVGLAVAGQVVSYNQASYEYSKRVTVINVQANYNAQRIGLVLIDGNRG